METGILYTLHAICLYKTALYLSDMKKLEEYKAFRYVAWVLVVGFALFTAHLALTLNDNLGVLAALNSI